MSTSARPSGSINWLHVSTVVSAAMLIAAEVFGAAFAGGWAVAILFDLGGYSHYVLQAIFFACGLAVMAAFLRSARRIEPFTKK
jgi:hypothetical protein